MLEGNQPYRDHCCSRLAADSREAWNPTTQWITVEFPSISPSQSQPRGLFYLLQNSSTAVTRTYLTFLCLLTSWEMKSWCSNQSARVGREWMRIIPPCPKKINLVGLMLSKGAVGNLQAQLLICALFLCLSRNPLLEWTLWLICYEISDQHREENAFVLHREKMVMWQECTYWPTGRGVLHCCTK